MPSTFFTIPLLINDLMIPETVPLFISNPSTNSFCDCFLILREFSIFSSFLPEVVPECSVDLPEAVSLVCPEGLPIVTVNPQDNLRIKPQVSLPNTQVQ